MKHVTLTIELIRVTISMPAETSRAYDYQHAAEQESLDELEREQHIGGLCYGAPCCGYCLDEYDDGGKHD